MNKVSIEPRAAPAPGLTLSDIYYILFRHKWRILICTLIGVGVAGALYHFQSVPYTSSAKLYVRYVVSEEKVATAPGAAMDTKSPDRAGETIMSSEVEVLTSFDLAKTAAEVVGPEKILAKNGGGNDLLRAAAIISDGLTVNAPLRTSVILLSFTNGDSAIVGPVLRAVIDSYLKRHLEIHQAVGMLGDLLTQETDQLRAQLGQTEESLRKALNKAGVISLEDGKRTYADQTLKLRQEIRNVQAEIAERTAAFQEIVKQSAAAKGPESDKKDAEAPVAKEVVTPAKVDEYRALVARVEALRKHEQDLLLQFKPEYSLVKDTHAELAAAEQLKQKLEADFPVLVRPSASGGNSSSGPGSPVLPNHKFDVVSEGAMIVALQSRLKILSAQLEALRAESAVLDEMEGTISELRRKKDLQSASYSNMSRGLEQARINEALGTGRVSNITEIEKPTPPIANFAKLFRLVGGVAFGGIAIGIGWAFLFELCFDHSIRRPKDVEKFLRIPLFLSIPRMRKKKTRKASDKSDRSVSYDISSSQDASLAVIDHPLADATLVPWDPKSGLQEFHETLRDRLIGYFESVNLTHKPKLVAVTGLTRKAGVSTTAAGLASSLSETGEGNVLLVDLTTTGSSSHHFFRGKPVCGLDELLETRESAQVESNLYVAAEGTNGEKLSQALPQRFSKLVPKLKASNFDYIIFDMPPVSQLSITPRVASFMDMVLMVIESEKNDNEVVKRAVSLLGASKAHLGVVLNKTKEYVPKRLHQEYLPDA